MKYWRRQRQFLYHCNMSTFVNHFTCSESRVTVYDHWNHDYVAIVTYDHSQFDNIRIIYHYLEEFYCCLCGIGWLRIGQALSTNFIITIITMGIIIIIIIVMSQYHLKNSFLQR